jgi:hypothetical protein
MTWLIVCPYCGFIQSAACGGNGYVFTCECCNGKFTQFIDVGHLASEVIYTSKKTGSYFPGINKKPIDVSFNYRF